MKKSMFGVWAAAGLALAGCVSRQAADQAKEKQGTDWGAIQWIGDGKANPTNDADFYHDDPAPLFRKTFEIPAGRTAVSAKLEIAGLGYYDVSINGSRVSATSLMPLWTPYAKTILFDTYEVSDKLVPGKNVITVELGNGWYNPLPLRMWGHYKFREQLAVGRPCFKVNLQLSSEKDGNAQSIVSDATWRMAEGPILRNNVYLGVTVDARREIAGWQLPEFDDSAWKPAAPMQGPAGKLLPRTAPPLHAFSPVAGLSRWLTNEVQVVDFGANGSGVAEFQLGKGAAGEKIVFRYGELLHPNGNVNPLTQTAGQIKRKGMGGPGAPDLAEPLDVYIRNGKGDEVFRPRFCWHAFRYAQVEGLKELLKPQDSTRYTIASAVVDAGTFECSDLALTHLHAVCRQTFLSNLYGVQSDCPGRERFGYGGDIAATAEALMMDFDMREFYLKTLQDFADEAENDGWITETAPYVGIASEGFGGRSGPIGWTIVAPVLIDELYRYYGDNRALAYYPVCARYVRLLNAKFPNHLLPHCIGDHEALDKAPTDLTATAHYYQFVKLTASLAKKMNNTADAGAFNVLADDIRTAFLKKYTQGGKVGTGRQDEQAYGLYLGLLPDSQRQEALRILAENIQKHDNAVSTGIFATKYMLETLSNEGLEDLAGKVVTHKGFPGWMNMLDNGATTLWETWKESHDVYSNNHPMFGSVDEWLMKHALGISVARDAVGSDKISVQPQAVAGITWARGSYTTPKGEVKLSWWLDKNGTLRMKLHVPGGVAARVWLASQKRWVEVWSGDHQW